MKTYNNIDHEEWQNLLKNIMAPMTNDEIELQQAYRMETCPPIDIVQSYENIRGI